MIAVDPPMTEPGREWDAIEVASHLRSAAESTSRKLAELARRGFVRRLDNGRYAFAKDDAQRARCCS